MGNNLVIEDFEGATIVARDNVAGEGCCMLSTDIDGEACCVYLDRADIRRLVSWLQACAE